MNYKYCLSLSNDPLRFEPLRKMTTIFYDDKSTEIFTIIHSDDVMQIIVENTTLKKKSIYLMKQKIHVISLKFSPDQKILGLQHDNNAVDFVSFSNYVQCSSFTQCSKTNNSKLLGFIWITDSEILFITNLSLELYQMDTVKKNLKCIKCVSISIYWFLYFSKKNFILLCTGPNGAHLQPYYVIEGNFIKLPRLEAENFCHLKEPKQVSILERDVTLALCYDHIRVLLLQHVQTGCTSSTDIAVYTISKTTFTKKTHVLKLLELSRRFALNVVDDLIVVHHQISKTSYIFDIGSTFREDDLVSVIMPIVDGMSIETPKNIECELYSSHWVTFQPNIIIDVGIGAFWYLNLHLEHFLTLINDQAVLTDFLLQRKDGKPYLIQMLHDVILNQKENLEKISQLFNRLNVIYKDKLEIELQSNVGLPVSSSITVQICKPQLKAKNVLSQIDLYTNVFIKIADNTFKFPTLKHNKHFIGILLEYICSLTDHNITVQHCIYELLINTLVFNKYFNQLHQILQYHVISDSKPLACLLLSLENVYPPARQLALDMLFRISNATEEITEILLSKQQVIDALKFSDTYGTESEISFRKYLDVANSVDDPDVFYSIFIELEHRNQSSSKNVDQFSIGGHCDKYIEAFNEKYRK